MADLDLRMLQSACDSARGKLMQVGKGANGAEEAYAMAHAALHAARSKIPSERVHLRPRATRRA